jgi:endonuclease G
MKYFVGYSLAFISFFGSAEYLELDSGLLGLESEYFYIEYNCMKRGAEYFEYTTQFDMGEIPRVHKFTQDTRIPKSCRQFSTKSYKRGKGEKPTYDRGHEIEQNVVDHSLEAMKLSNRFTNIVPQVAKLNRTGPWRQTEILTECYRDIGKLTVMGGVIWGTNTSDDYFIESHGVPTPDYLYKIHYMTNKGTQAWLIPNTQQSATMHLDDFLISIVDLEEYTGRIFNVPDHYKANVALQSWKKTKHCSLK